MSLASGDLVALAAALSWAVTSLLARAVSGDVTPLVYNTLRCAVSAALVLPLLPWALSRSDVAAIQPAAIALLVGSAVAGMGVGDTAFFESIRRIGVARALPIANTYPLVTASLAVIVLGETVNLGLVAGMVIVGFGVWLLTSEGSRSTTAGDRKEFTAGVILAVIAAIGWAGSSILVRPALQSIDVVLAQTIRMPVAVGLLILVGMPRSTRFTLSAVPRRAVPLILVAGAVTTISMTLWLWAVDLIGAARAAAVTSATPLFAAPFAFILFREQPTVRLLAGIAVTVFGLLLVVMA